ncbi:MAG: transketolase [Candidatus Dadabacteria bacterium]|nr:MAG: transketolase [Candidatus Dadabacteria bacterium]
MLTVLFWEVLNKEDIVLNVPWRNKFILSKGHAALALYTVLYFKGILPEELYSTVGDNGSILAEHPPFKPELGLEAATGSLGHGLSIGAGLALGAKLRGWPSRVYVLLSDGECNEGSVWEAAMFASSKQLNNITAVVDFNKWQATGRSEEILAISPLKEKFISFGWEAVEINGHSFTQLKDTLCRRESEKPLAIIAHTVKGKGVSFMEDDNNWHYRIPSEEDVAKAFKELK